MNITNQIWLARHVPRVEEEEDNAGMWRMMSAMSRDRKVREEESATNIELGEFRLCLLPI